MPRGAAMLCLLISSACLTSCCSHRVPEAATSARVSCGRHSDLLCACCSRLCVLIVHHEAASCVHCFGAHGACWCTRLHAMPTARVSHVCSSRRRMSLNEGRGLHCCLVQSTSRLAMDGVQPHLFRVLTSRTGKCLQMEGFARRVHTLWARCHLVDAVK